MQKMSRHQMIIHNFYTACMAECLTSESESSVIELMCFLIISLIEPLSHLIAMSLSDFTQAYRTFATFSLAVACIMTLIIFSMTASP